MVEQFAGQYDESIQLLEPRVHELPQFEPAIGVLADDYLLQQKNNKAIELIELAPAAADSSRPRDAILGLAYAKTGQRAKAADMLQRTIAGPHHDEPLPYEAAIIYTALSDKDKALEMLELALNKREPAIVFLNVDPLLASLRSEERFRQLLTQMNLE
jgi:tetratricopeptide (TPR) repeat protein